LSVTWRAISVKTMSKRAATSVGGSSPSTDLVDLGICREKQCKLGGEKR
jgi:hypothetical protein